MKVRFMVTQVAPRVFDLSYRRWLFWWYKVGEEVDGNFFPKRFGSLDEAMDYASEVSSEIAAK